MQLLCNGVLLDLKQGAALSFKKSNILFAFDSVECERSISFDLPDTPNNEAVFDLAKDPAFSGNGMRRKFVAELRDGLMVKTGYLHVEQYAKGNYKAVFVCGELVGLQALRDAGKVSGLLTYNDVATWGSFPFTPVNGRSALWTIINYTRKTGDPFPSYKLQQIIADTMTALGVTCTLPTDDRMTGMRVVPGELKGFAEQVVEFEEQQTGAMTQGSFPVITTVSIPEASTILTTETKELLLRSDQGMTITTYGGRATQLVAKQDLTLQFPDDWDDTLFVGRFIGGGTQFVAEFEFLGDRSFDENGTVTGDSLRGRSVDVAAGEAFVIISSDYYKNGNDSGGTHWQGWFYGTGHQTECTFTLSGKVSATGQAVRLQDNLPELTAVELLKVVQAITGKQLYYDGAVSFDPLAFDTWSLKDCTDNLLSIEKVQRRFSDYAQTNIVRYKSGDQVLEGSKITLTYTIANENIEAEKDLQVVPFSEGNRDGSYLMLEAEDAETLAYADAALPKMRQMPLTKSSPLQTLCDRSTAIEAKVYMSLQEWEELTPKTRVQVRGLRYVWTSGTWSKGVATLNLSQIP